MLNSDFFFPSYWNLINFLFIFFVFLILRWFLPNGRIRPRTNEWMVNRHTRTCGFPLLLFTFVSLNTIGLLKGNIERRNGCKVKEESVQMWEREFKLYRKFVFLPLAEILLWFSSYFFSILLCFSLFFFLFYAAILNWKNNEIRLEIFKEKNWLGQ